MRIVIDESIADLAQTVMNAGQKAMRAYRDWLKCPSAELRAIAERKRDLYEGHRKALLQAAAFRDMHQKIQLINAQRAAA